MEVTTLIFALFIYLTVHNALYSVLYHSLQILTYKLYKNIFSINQLVIYAQCPFHLQGVGGGISVWCPWPQGTKHILFALSLCIPQVMFAPHY